MTKRWDSTKALAVDRLSFQAYSGQVFRLLIYSIIQLGCLLKVSVLLGHNGAGKSTTFSVLSGTVRCTSGQVILRGQDISENLRYCQRQLGYCPQFNPLFEKVEISMKSNNV